MSARANSPAGSADIAVVGGGAIGLAVAWRCAQRGAEVALFDSGPLGSGSSAVAAGMLAPISEAEYGAAGRRLLELGLDSAARWPGFAAELAAASGTESCLRREGTLIVARDRDIAAALEREHAFRVSLGLPIERLVPSAARALEPALAPSIRLALHAPDDHSVDPVWVTDALARAAEAAGARLHAGTPVALELEGDRVRGVRTAAADSVVAGHVVVAAGAWSGALSDLPPRARVPVRPVKGQILGLSGAPLLTRSLRFDGGYLVPRGDGRYVLGATVEERGFDTSVTAAGAYELLRDAAEVIPDVLELRLETIRAGLRPGTPDNVPLIGPGALDGLVWATGHYRNGILLTPITADAIAELLAGGGPAPSACDPLRFATAEVPA